MLLRRALHRFGADLRLTWLATAGSVRELVAFCRKRNEIQWGRDLNIEPALDPTHVAQGRTHGAETQAKAAGNDYDEKELTNHTGFTIGGTRSILGRHAPGVIDPAWNTNR